MYGRSVLRPKSQSKGFMFALGSRLSFLRSPKPTI